MGKWSTCAVTLALYDSDEGRTTSLSSNAEKDGIRREGDVNFVIPKFRILVVDGSFANRKLLIR
jgi:hypothetical protein